MAADSSTPTTTKQKNANQAPIVSLHNIAQRFKTPTGQVVTALENIDLNIYPNEFISIIGPSGCGKSTLLRIVADLLSPTSGTATVNGKPPHQARLNRDFGMVFQQAVLYEWRSVIKNIELPLEIMNYSPVKRANVAREMLELVELGEFAHHYPWQLSGGMQQRVAIARALTFKPSILLMDEPFGALDEMTRERMNIELMSIWTKTNTTVIFITHSIQEAVYLSSRVVVMSPRPGRIIKDIPITLPYPRAPEVRDTEDYFHLVTEVRAGLR
jgi:NitT/TauT family transport system ATP-binding protein